ncbi:thioredoxin-like protein [Melampsora americana]|nr:thioredoxin-like protein [Melampsora americana]
MPKKRTSTSELDPESSIQPRRSSRVTSKPNSFSSSRIPSPKQNGTSSASKSATKSKSEEEGTGSISALTSVEDDEKEIEKPPVQKKAKLGKSSETKSESSDSIVKLKVGDKLSEEIVLKNQEDEDLNLLEAVKEKGAIIFIYPKANTPGCTNQACGFRDLHQEILDAGYQVFGLSMDSPKSQKSWKEKQKLPYNLLCDPKQQLIKILGASKSSTQVQRSHYIIAPGGELLNVTSPASPKNGPGQALEFIKAL